MLLAPTSGMERFHSCPGRPEGISHKADSQNIKKDGPALGEFPYICQSKNKQVKP
ncbi:hypothetical protein HMPREF9446_02008 [Bacteroides fluxus YIT 12057]|uniref:Uncharacterized protein n=1 Tax=Bacteroides fluxus YIT 12057 TaxID=763034 RepID=F3PTE0_9BACE|nr:hypothetical protein HMPREF9446_02008 [Bacteroides fluxus YIT 12057]